MVGNFVTNLINIQFLQQQVMISLAEPLPSAQETFYRLKELCGLFHYARVA
jgi:hypothetical protein